MLTSHTMTVADTGDAILAQRPLAAVEPGPSGPRAPEPRSRPVRAVAMLHAALLLGLLPAPSSAQVRERQASPAGASSTIASTEVPGPGRLASMTPEQEATLQSAIAARRSDRQFGRDVAEAAPLIARVVRTSACGFDNGAWTALGRDAVAPLVEPLFAPLRTGVARFNDGHHDPRHCYDVVRIGEVSKPAANALRFSAYMVSPDSGSATTRTFELVRMDGRWLVRWIT